jgi:hypothetical protein
VLLTDARGEDEGRGSTDSFVSSLTGVVADFFGRRSTTARLTWQIVRNKETGPFLIVQQTANGEPADPFVVAEAIRRRTTAVFPVLWTGGVGTLPFTAVLEAVRRIGERASEGVLLFF